MKTIKLTELDLNRIVKRVLSEQEEANYMFFSNLKQMKRQLEMIMDMIGLMTIFLKPKQILTKFLIS
jgi:hypothetical protein